MSAPQAGASLTGTHLELAVLCLKHAEASIDFEKVAKEMNITKNAVSKRYKRMMEKITAGETASPSPATGKTGPKTPVSKRKRAPAKSAVKATSDDDEDDDEVESSPTKKPAPRKRAKSTAAPAKAKKAANPKVKGFMAVNAPKDANTSDDENDVKTEEKTDTKVKADVKAEVEAEDDGDVKDEDDAEEE